MPGENNTASESTATEDRSIDDIDSTVFVVDDHAGFRRVAASVVEAAHGFALVGSAADGTEALLRLANLEAAPDLILMDVNLGTGSGIDATRQLLAEHPKLTVVFVSALTEDELPVDARTSGAVGYIPKGHLSPDALRHIRSGAYNWRP